MSAATQTPIRYISVADTAKLIRTDLKTAFPTIKFRVTSKKYSGGASIDVRWVDGPTANAVERITKRYEGATFDAMEDLKSYVDSTEVDANGELVRIHYGSNYVFPSRSTTREFLEGVSAAFKAHFGWDGPEVKGEGTDAYADIHDWSYSTWATHQDRVSWDHTYRVFAGGCELVDGVVRNLSQERKRREDAAMYAACDLKHRLETEPELALTTSLTYDSKTNAQVVRWTVEDGANAAIAKYWFTDEWLPSYCAERGTRADRFNAVATLDGRTVIVAFTPSEV